MSEAIEKKKQTAGDLIRSMVPQIKMALPKSMDAERMARIALTMFRTTPKLQECSIESFLGALMMCAQTGLEPGVSGEAYIIPYYNNKTKQMEAQYQQGYKGKLKLIRNSDQLSTINAHVVHEKDHFEIEYGSNENLTHRPYDGEGDPGKVKGVYAAATLKDGGKQFVYLPLREINKIRNVSKCNDSGPWKEWEEEMMKKTAIHRIAKVLPMSTEDRRKLAQDETTKLYHVGQTVDIMNEEDITDWSTDEDEKPKLTAPEQKPKSGGLFPKNETTAEPDSGQ